MIAHNPVKTEFFTFSTFANGEPSDEGPIIRLTKNSNSLSYSVKHFSFAYLSIHN